MAEENKKDNELKQPSESAENPEKEKALAKVTKLFWVALGILIFLLVLSIVILSTRMYKYAKLEEEGRVIKIESNSVENFELFSAEYKDDSGQIKLLLRVRAKISEFPKLPRKAL